MRSNKQPQKVGHSSRRDRDESKAKSQDKEAWSSTTCAPSCSLPASVRSTRGFSDRCSLDARRFRDATTRRGGSGLFVVNHINTTVIFQEVERRERTKEFMRGGRARRGQSADERAVCWPALRNHRRTPICSRRRRQAVTGNTSLPASRLLCDTPSHGWGTGSKV